MTHIPASILCAFERLRSEGGTVDIRTAHDASGALREFVRVAVPGEAPNYLEALPDGLKKLNPDVWAALCGDN